MRVSVPVSSANANKETERLVLVSRSTSQTDSGDEGNAFGEWRRAAQEGGMDEEPQTKPDQGLSRRKGKKEIEKTR